MNRPQNATPIQHTIAVYQVVQMLQAIDGEDARAAVLRRALGAAAEAVEAHITGYRFEQALPLVRAARGSGGPGRAAGGSSLKREARAARVPYQRLQGPPRRVFTYRVTGA